MSYCKFLWGNPCMATETFCHWDSCLWDSRFSMFFSHTAAWKNSEVYLAVSILNAYWYRDGKCNCLHLNTTRWFPIANNLQESFFHAVVSPDSEPRLSFHDFRFWSQNSWFVDSARFFFSPLSSICDNQGQLSSDESPGHTIPIWSWVSQRLILNLNKLSKMSSDGNFVIDKRIPHHFESNSCVYRLFEEQLNKGRHNSRQNRWLQWSGSTLRSGKRSVFHKGNGDASHDNFRRKLCTNTYPGFLIYHACPKCLAAYRCGPALSQNGLAFL